MFIRGLIPRNSTELAEAVPIEVQRYVSCDSLFVSLFDLILYVPSTIFQLYRDGSSWVEPELS